MWGQHTGSCFPLSAPFEPTLLLPIEIFPSPLTHIVVGLSKRVDTTCLTCQPVKDQL
jgi:hypothetical protein